MKLTIKPQHLDVRLKPGAWVDPARMLEKIRDAGFKAVPGDVRLTATGTVVKQGQTLVLVLDRMKSPLSLPVVADRANPDTAAHLDQHAGQGVELEGLWQPPAAGQTGPGALAVTSIRIKKEK